MRHMYSNKRNVHEPVHRALVLDQDVHEGARGRRGSEFVALGACLLLLKRDREKQVRVSTLQVFI